MGIVDWIDLIQDRDKWPAVVKNSKGPSPSTKCGDCWLAEELSASQE